MALQRAGKMRRQHPRILGSLRNPLPLPLQTPPLYFFPASVHLIPSQPSSLHPAIYVHPLSVFYPTSFPTLKNTFYFPTLMMAMPSSSCLAKLSANRPTVFQPSSYLSTLMTTPPRRAPLERYLVSLSHPEADCPQLDWELRNNSPDMEPGIKGNELAPTSLVQGKQPRRHRLETRKRKRVKPWLSLAPSLNKHEIPKRQDPHVTPRLKVTSLCRGQDQ